MTLIIPYTSDQLYWHLQNNVLNLGPETINKIVEQCNLINMGEMDLTDEIAENSGITIADMLSDLKIDFND